MWHGVHFGMKARFGVLGLILLFLVYFYPYSSAPAASYYIGQCGKPSLGVRATSIYWANYADYQERLLSVDYTISNDSGPDAMSVTILGSMNTSGVILSTSTPVELGHIYKDNSASLTLRFSVSGGATIFMSTLFATAGDYCDSAYEYPGPFPGEPEKFSESWIRPPQTYLDDDGLHIYAATTNRFTNAIMADNDSNGIADGWTGFNGNGNYTSTLSVQPPTGITPGEQVIHLTATGTPTSTEWFGLWMSHNYPDTKWAVSTEVKIDWLPGTTQQEKNALADLAVSANGFQQPTGVVLDKSDIGSGWMRLYSNSMTFAANKNFYTQLHCRTSAQNWSSAAGGLEIRFRRPQLENTLSEKGFAFTTPAALPLDPGVTINANGEAVRELGFAQVGHDHENGEQGDSPVRVDTSKDWGMFVQWVPMLNAREIIPNDNEWQILNLDNHWDAPSPFVHNEIHLDIDGGNDLGDENRLFLFLWNAEGLANDWMHDSVDLNDFILKGDDCRLAYWKAGDMHYAKLNVYRNGVLVISRLMGNQLTVSQDAGIMKQLTVGIDHREVGYGQTHSANGVFQHISVEEATLDEASIDSFMASGTRPKGSSTVITWDYSSGNDKVYMRPY